MKLAQDMWLGSVTARNNLMAAASYSAAFYGNAALQSWSLGLTAPQVFWAAMARAVAAPEAEAVNEDAEPGAPEVEPPMLSLVEETAPAEAALEAVIADVAPVGDSEDAVEVVPVEATPEEDAATAADAPDPAGETAFDSVASPLLLDAPRGGQADDLTAIKGIGAKMAANLNEFGIYHYDQIAGLDEAGVEWLDDHLPGFKRNVARFDVITGARQFL